MEYWKSGMREVCREQEAGKQDTGEKNRLKIEGLLKRLQVAG